MNSFSTPFGWVTPGCPGYYSDSGACTYDASIFQPNPQIITDEMRQGKQVVLPLTPDFAATHVTPRDSWLGPLWQDLAAPFLPPAAIQPIINPVAITAQPISTSKVLRKRRKVLRKKPGLHGFASDQLRSCHCHGISGISPVVRQDAPSDPVIQNAEAGIITGLIVSGLAGNTVFEGPADTVGGEFIPGNPFGLPTSGNIGTIQPMPIQQPGFIQSIGQGIGRGIGTGLSFGQGFSTPPITTWLLIVAAIMIVPPLLKK